MTASRHKILAFAKECNVDLKKAVALLPGPFPESQSMRRWVRVESFLLSERTMATQMTVRFVHRKTDRAFMEFKFTVTIEDSFTIKKQWK